MKILRALLSSLVLSAALCGAAQSRESPQWIPLDPSIPEHAAIIAWHRALIDNDYDTWIRYRGRLSGISEASMRKYFADSRLMTPPTLMITAKPDRVHSNGVKEYYIAGCKRLFGDPDEVRLIASVMPIQKDGQWRLSGSDFSTPWNKTLRECPVR